MTSSVTGCSTCRRVFISMNQNDVGSSAGTRNSTVPTPTYPTDRATSHAASPSRARVASSSAGEGASSTTFW